MAHDMLSADEIYARACSVGLTIEDLAYGAGVAPSTFVRWKAGKTSPTLDVYTRVVAALLTAEQRQFEMLRVLRRRPPSPSPLRR
jgi:predicted transcriptional regulator